MVLTGRSRYLRKESDKVMEWGLMDPNIISTKLIMMMLAKDQRVLLLSATLLSLTSLVCFAFAENTDLPVTVDYHSIGEETACPFQESLDQWARGPTVMGRELVPQKLWCYPISFVGTGTK